MPNFDSLQTIARADEILRAATPDFVRINADYVAGNHLRDGEEWIGPPPPEEMREEGLADLALKWTPAPVVNECLENHVSGITGREIGFELVRRATADEITDDDPLEIQRDAINAAIGAWWDKRGALGTLQEWTERLLWASRAPMRLFVPPGLMEKAADGSLRLPDISTPEEALEYIYLDAPNAESATVYTDSHSRRQCGLYRYTHSEAPANGLVSLVGETKQRLERVFVADANEGERGPNRPGIKKGQTVLQIIEPRQLIGPTQNAAAQPADSVVAEVVFPCGGYSLMFEARRPLVFTDPVRRLQRAVNLLNTLLGMNAVYAGFRSRDYMNATPPRDEDDNDMAITSGPAQAMFWYSQPYTVKHKDGTTETKYMPVSLVTTEPVDSGPLLEVKNDFERQLRRAFRQEHTFQTGSSQQSAVALIQQRAAYLVHLLQTKPAVEDALVWLQGALWCFALYLSGNANQIDEFLQNFRATAMAKPYTGPLTPEEVRGIIEMVAARLMPREMAAGLLGVDDLDAFIAAIEREDRVNPDLMLKRLQIRRELLASGMAPLDASLLAGFDEETAAKMTGAAPPSSE